MIEVIALLTTLPVHLDGEHVCYFDENMNEDEIREKIENDSELLAYFELNKNNVLARNLFYHEIPEKFVFRKGKWNERKTHFNTIGRMVKISPAETERYHLRLLLLNVRGAIGYEDLRTVKNIDLDNRIRCATFAEACLARGLIRDDEEWKKALEEANSFEMPWKMRELFALILVYCNPAKPDELWALFKDALSEDFAKKFSIELAHRKAYIDIAKRMLQAVHLLRGMKKKVSTMAFTGIAATLLPGGRTMHNRFGLNLDMSNSKIGPCSKAWKELKDIDLFICDEAPMVHKRALVTIDLKLKEIMNSNIDFGGKVMMMAGDFRQTLPIQKHATRAEICDLTIQKQDFAKDLLEIGSGKWNNDKDEMKLPMNCVSKGDLVEEIFGYAIADSNWNEVAKMAIVAPKNVDVKDLNSRVLNMIPGNEKLYTSIDKAENEEKQVLDDPNGFPLHELRLKKYAIVMLIRNLNIENGLCNGTRMMVEEMRPNMIVCRLLTGDRLGQLAYIPRITLRCDGEYPFDLHRHQFPLVLAFAMTVNKAQGQTLEKLGIDLTKDVFSHGQLYVALSRVRTWKALSIRLLENNNERKVMNVVYKEILDKDD
uniref:ATP-dependent DNA helicase n=1 Tax=Meloidogyne hapla TaxID=6305 RepID=A0A1I8BYJ7_MELHA